MLPPAEETSPTLIERVRAEDPEAWHRLVRIFGPTVYGWARRAGLQPSDAADIVQEVFAAVAKGLASFRKRGPGDSFRGWLRTICRNEIRDYYRRAAGSPQAVGGTTANLRIQSFEERAGPEDDEETLADSRQIYLRAMRECRSLFEDRVWEAFWRVVADGGAPADVARDLGLSVWAVYKARSRVLERLRRELGGLIVLEAS